MGLPVAPAHSDGTMACSSTSHPASVTPRICVVKWELKVGPRSAAHQACLRRPAREAQRAIAS